MGHAYGHVPLLDDVSLQLEPGERVALIGRNGSGKSTLLRIVSGELEPDRGTVWRAPGVRSARLEQDVPLAAGTSVFEVVAEGLGELSALVAAYHHATVEVAHGQPSALDEMGRLQHELEELDGWRLEQRVEMVLSRLQLPADAPVQSLSGGWRRRVMLARALVASPDVLLLDEPTNHLDIDAIEWLEAFLADYAGAVLFVTHDRAFLDRLATRVVELDRGRLTSWPGDYATFVRKKEEWLENEALANEKFDKTLAVEEVWLRRGIKARRTRDEGRVKRLSTMRAERAARRSRAGRGSAVHGVGRRARQDGVRGRGRTEGVRRPRRDPGLFHARRCAAIASASSGPTAPARPRCSGSSSASCRPTRARCARARTCRWPTSINSASSWIPSARSWTRSADGNDQVTVAGRTRHVHGYLEDFLFPPERARSPVKALSGGERNRLLLARLLTRPANVLVLDEPTNDLDLETLELLESQLVDWPGTLLVVSHDRTVPGPRGHEHHRLRRRRPRGGVRGGLRGLASPAARASRRSVQHRRRPRTAEGAAVRPAVTAQAVRGQARKATNKERRELEELPARIEALEEEQRRLATEVAAPDFYKRPGAEIEAVMARLASLPDELLSAYARWDELDGLR